MLPEEAQQKLLHGILENIPFWKQIPVGVYELLITANNDIFTVEESKDVFNKFVSPMIAQAEIIEPVQLLCASCGIQFPPDTSCNSLPDNIMSTHGLQTSNESQQVEWAIRVDKLVAQAPSKVSLEHLNKKINGISHLLDMLICFLNSFYEPSSVEEFCAELLCSPFAVPEAFLKFMEDQSKKQKRNEQIQVANTIHCMFELSRIFLFLAPNCPASQQRSEMLLDLYISYDIVLAKLKVQEAGKLSMLPCAILCQASTSSNDSAYQNRIYSIQAFIRQNTAKSLTGQERKKLIELCASFVARIATVTEAISEAIVISLELELIATIVRTVPMTETFLREIFCKLQATSKVLCRNASLAELFITVLYDISSKCQDAFFTRQYETLVEFSISQNYSQDVISPPVTPKEEAILAAVNMFEVSPTEEYKYNDIESSKEGTVC